MFWFYLWFYKTKTVLIISTVFVCLVELEAFDTPRYWAISVFFEFIF